MIGDIRHHDLRISHPCPTNPRSCPPPLISYRPYGIELTTLTMTKSNPMYLILGGSHPHAFLHDRRMVGRDMQNEWGSISWNSETTTQVRPQRRVLTKSVSVGSLPTESAQHHDGVCISRRASFLRPDRMNSLAHGLVIQYICLISTILLLQPVRRPLEQNPLQRPTRRHPLARERSENVQH